MADYPSHIPPLNATIDLEDTTASVGAVQFTDIAQQAVYDAAKAAKDAQLALAFAQNDESTNGLTWGYLQTIAAGRSIDWSQGFIRRNMNRHTVAPGTVELEASATNYVEYNVTTHAVTVNSDGFTEGETALDLWEIETGPSSIIRMTDRRRWLLTAGDVTEVGDGEGGGVMEFGGDPLEFGGDEVVF